MNSDLSVTFTGRDEFGNVVTWGDWCTNLAARLASPTITIPRFIFATPPPPFCHCFPSYNLRVEIIFSTPKLLFFSIFFCRAVSITTIGNGKCQLHYVASSPGSHTLDLSYLGTPISGSPFRPVLVSTLTPLDAIKSFVLNPEDLQSAIATKPWGPGTVQMADSGGRWLSSSNATVTAVGTARSGGATVDLLVSNNGDGSYSINGKFPVAGMYDVSVRVSGTLIRDMPLAVNVSPLDPLAITSDQLPRVQEIGQSLFTVRSDPAGTTLSSTDWVFTVVTPEKTFLPAPDSASNVDPKQLSVSFGSNNPGTYTPIGTFIKTLTEFVLGTISIRLPSFIMVPESAQTATSPLSFTLFGHKLGIPESQYLANPLGYSWGACVAVVTGPGSLERRQVLNLTDVKDGTYTMKALLREAGIYRVYAADCNGAFF